MTRPSWRWSNLSSNPTGKESRSNARAHSGPPWGGPFVFLGCKRKRLRWEPEAFWFVVGLLSEWCLVKRRAWSVAASAPLFALYMRCVILCNRLVKRMQKPKTIRFPSRFSLSCAWAASLRMAFQSVDACACRGNSRPSERGPLRALPGAATMETGGWGRMTGTEYRPSLRKRETPSASGSSVTGSAATGLGNARH